MSEARRRPAAVGRNSLESLCSSWAGRKTPAGWAGEFQLNHQENSILGHQENSSWVGRRTSAGGQEKSSGSPGKLQLDGQNSIWIIRKSPAGSPGEHQLDGQENSTWIIRKAPSGIGPHPSSAQGPAGTVMDSALLPICAP